MYPTIKSNEVYLEAQIQNITQSPLVMEKVLLEPTAEYKVKELNTIETNGVRYVQVAVLGPIS